MSTTVTRESLEDAAREAMGHLVRRDLTEAYHVLFWTLYPTGRVPDGDWDVRAMQPVRDRIHKRYGADCEAGHRSGIRKVQEITDRGTRTWHECMECGVTVKAPCCEEDDA